MKNRGLTIRSVAKGLPAWKSGLRNRDVVVSVDGVPVEDEVDFRFFTSQSVSMIRLRRGASLVTVRLERPLNTLLGAQFAEDTVRRCSNCCIFCFIDQMPKGLRKTLYIKDEDVKHSFVNGNYVTLGAMSYHELDRICALGLSPLYVSVHATAPAVRRRMLGNRTLQNITQQLRFLEKNNVSFHTQIVVCPGFNNGAVLNKSIDDLFAFKKGLLSIAIVPVGLTRFKRKILKPVDRDEARRICATVSAKGEKDKLRHGRRRIFLADEMFLLAGHPIPPRSYYQNYPQIENGVGLVRMLLDEWKEIKLRHGCKHQRITSENSTGSKRLLIVTSESAYPFLKKISADLGMFFPGVVAEAFAIRNHFFGGMVTVAGLLTGSDIIRQVKAVNDAWDRVVVPGVVFNARGHTLDGYSAQRIEKHCGVKVIVADSLTSLLGTI
jgi:putative radical SAM enzyme (TIGR03279 family)